MISLDAVNGKGRRRRSVLRLRFALSRLVLYAPNGVASRMIGREIGPQARQRIPRRYSTWAAVK